MENIKLTQYSHGAGCGCKISPKILDQILQDNQEMPDHKKLLVGNHSRDDAAVYDLENGNALIMTTDFFMPIVDDPYDFGRIAAANAISDVYAMGGKPILAIAILGWPVNILSANIAKKVIEGGRSICREANIPLAGGHSIDSPEPIFGLAVNGIVPIKNIKQNNTARPGDWIYLTKPIGSGILTTAEKKRILQPQHVSLAAQTMMQLNQPGEILGGMQEVTAMTDVTGFGLAGHLCEITEGSNCTAELSFDKIPFIVPELEYYISRDAIPGGMQRNWESYGYKIEPVTDFQKNILADPQTSGGLLFTVKNNARKIAEERMKAFLPAVSPVLIGQMTDPGKHLVILHQ
jgi:selenide, water dikinase